MVIPRFSHFLRCAVVVIGWCGHNTSRSALHFFLSQTAFLYKMMQLRILTVLVLLLVSCVEICEAKTRLGQRWRGKLRENRQNAQPETNATSETEIKAGIETQPETQLATRIGDTAPKTDLATEDDATVVVPGGMMHGMGLGPAPRMNGQDGGAPLSVVGASSYAGFWCGPVSTPTHDGLEDIQNNCDSRPICKYKRVDDGPAGKRPIPELEDGEPKDCMHRGDPKDGLEGFCEKFGEETYPFVMGCPCPNLSGKGCHAWKENGD